MRLSNRETKPEKIDVNKAVEWLQKHWKNNTMCPVCTNNHWSVSEQLLELRSFQRGGIIVGGPIHPLSAVTCNVCGHTLLFNALVAGLMEK